MNIHQAIYNLYPQTVRIEDNNNVDAFDVEGNQVQYNKTAVQAYIDAHAYKQQRAFEYPSITDQLDMLWHAIDNGTLNKTSDFYTSIKAVKDAYPKSE